MQWSSMEKDASCTYDIQYMSSDSVCFYGTSHSSTLIDQVIF